MATVTDRILDELKEMRKEGCNIGAVNTTKIDALEKERVQHDKRIIATEKNVVEIVTKMDAMPAQITTQVIEGMNGSLKGNRTMIPIKIAGIIDLKIPAIWIGWAVVLGVMALMVSMNNMKSSDVQEALAKFHQIIEIGKVNEPGNDTTPE